MSKPYRHDGCGADDPCPKCSHSFIVFHAGGPCFHIDENHEEAALSRKHGRPFCGCKNDIGRKALPRLAVRYLPTKEVLDEGD